MALSNYTPAGMTAAQKEIKRQKNWSTGKMEWDMYYQGRYVGTRESKIVAEAELDTLAYEGLRRAAV
jgi:hypothetical protein